MENIVSNGNNQVIHSSPKCYEEACLKKGIEYYDYENVNIQWGDSDDYEIIEKIGRGNYSDLERKKFKERLKFLQNIANGPNVIALTDVVRDPASKTTSLVFDYVNNTDYKVMFPKLTDFDVRYYMYEVLKGLDFCHSQGIMHRDIKPHNIMIDYEARKVSIIDWGLAEFYLPKKDYNVRVSSRYFKGPELLVDYTYYDYSLDIWSFGCMLAGIVFMREPFFQGNDNYDQLEKITRVLGTAELFNYLEKYNIQLDQQYGGVLGQNQKKPFQKLVTQENQHLAVKEVVDLLSKILIYDHAQRLSAKEVMEHPYFAPVVEYHQQNKTKQNSNSKQKK